MPKTINQTYQDAYRLKKWRRWATILFLAGALVWGSLGGLYYVFFWSGWLTVRDVRIEQKGFIPNADISRVVGVSLNEKKWLAPMVNNLWLVDKNVLTAAISKNFPSLKNISVQKKFPSALVIKAESREAVGTWCFPKQGQCLSFDQEGVAFDRAADSSGTLLLIVNDVAGVPPELGQPVGSGERLEWLGQLKKELDKAKINIAKVILPEEPFRVDVKTAEGWEIYFSTTDPLLPQIRALSILLANKISFEQRPLLKYVDVRIPQRAYYKLNNPP